jgi:hypothetical protein
MSHKKFVIIPQNEITDEMREASIIEPVPSNSNTVVMNYRGSQPDCFNEYTELSHREWYDIYYGTDKANWGNDMPDAIKELIENNG